MLFWTIFCSFWREKIFQKNPGLACTTRYKFLAPCQNLEKINDPIPRKWIDRQTNGVTKVQALFHRTLLVNTGAAS